MFSKQRVILDLYLLSRILYAILNRVKKTGITPQTGIKAQLHSEIPNNRFLSSKVEFTSSFLCERVVLIAFLGFVDCLGNPSCHKL